MERPNVYVTCQLPAGVVELLQASCRVEVNPKFTPLPRAELLQQVRGRDAVLCVISDQIDEEVLTAAGPQCKIFANYGVGYDHMDILAATRAGILLSNTPDVVTDATADMAWCLLLATSRRLVEGDVFNRLQETQPWSPLFMLGQEVTGKTLGIVGAGRIGAAMAARAKGFRMRLVYSARSPKPEFEQETGAVYLPQEELLAEADFVSLHVPLTSATRHLMGKEQFRQMKSTAILINTARGPVVDEEALVAALKDGELWAAGLDVYEYEPKVHPELLTMKNVVLAPHLGTSTLETRTRMGQMAAENLLAGLAGKQPPHCLNPEVLAR